MIKAIICENVCIFLENKFIDITHVTHNIFFYYVRYEYCKYIRFIFLKILVTGIMYDVHGHTFINFDNYYFRTVISELFCHVYLYKILF